MGSAVTSNVVVRHVDRAPREVLAGFREVDTSTAHEAIGRFGFLGAHIRPVQQGARIAGSAVTVLVHPGDNIMIHAAIALLEPGDVLVVASTAPSANALFGELMATSAQARGGVGLITDGAVRDVDAIRQLGFPVWSQHIGCQGPVKTTPGWVNIPVVLGEQAVHPGDVVCADDTGVVVVPRRGAAEALAAARRRMAAEAVLRERFAAGELSVDIAGLDAKLAELGVVYVDRLEDLPAG
ncbi:MAG: 4-carboxy-4-hydroxy-2-oxoadipate aldolase/oxaloacetate decarboxylase [Acidimicrobiia bacterium]|nr:4-carboxy-4-hydroxy-2-oxoadipate aldolase/oxaloacetate decarboxylase [Acidimicrobiia bacterium]MYJ12768.1 4-carboxy-4-hydroxy-2-oxoadipate aldolase/oxaloacetate decarboxylase [Acidimicrobiia bacterium]